METPDLGLVFLMVCRWRPAQAVVDRLSELVCGGSSVRAAALLLELPLHVAYRLAHELQLPLRTRRKTQPGERDQITSLFNQGVSPMDIARSVRVDPSVVYRIGINMGAWTPNPQGRRAAATTRRCQYLTLRARAMGRKDAAAACGINIRCALDIDKGLIKSGATRIPFEPDGRDAALYKELMHQLSYVDGRVSVATEVIPQHRIDQRISTRYLGIEERERIADLHHQGLGVRAIARKIGRSPSTVCKELKRNSDDFDVYLPHVAHRKSVAKRLRPKVRKLDADEGLKQRVFGMLKEKLSPEQISGVLRKETDADAQGTRRGYVCHETIYQALYALPHGELKKELQQALRKHRIVRRPRGARKSRDRFTDAMEMITNRPKEAEDRTQAGHWEGDLIVGKNNKSAIGTLVERTTRFVMLLHLPNSHTAADVLEALVKQMSKLPAHLRRSLTWDQGSEMACHKAFQEATGCPVYFCFPGSPWQRGSNENTNGLLRQYFPKSSDLSIYDEEYLEKVADELNRRPRKIHNYHTPAELMQKLIESQGT